MADKQPIYAELPARYYVVGNESVWSAGQMRAFADATNALRAALAAPQPGYVLVPVEPTGVMLTAAEIALAGAAKTLGRHAAYAAAYRTMLAAAPKSPQQAAPVVTDDLRDRLVAISEAIADQDDRGAQAILREILKAQPAPSGDAEDAARLDWIAIHGSFGVDSVSGLVGGNGQRCVAATRKNIDAARKEGKL